MPITRYGAAFWQRLCDEVAKHMPPDWRVRFGGEVRRPDGEHNVAVLVTPPAGEERAMVVTFREGFDQLMPPQRLEAFRLMGSYCAGEILQLLTKPES